MNISGEEFIFGCSAIGAGLAVIAGIAGYQCFYIEG